MARPSHQQLERLVNFLERNPDLASNTMRCSEGRWQTSLLWEEEAIVLNSLGGAQKDARAWMRYWTGRKYSLRKRVAKRYASEYCPGSRMGVLPPLSNLDKRLLSLLGGSNFVRGERLRDPVSPLVSERFSPPTEAFQQSPPIPVVSTGCQVTPTDSPSRCKHHPISTEWQQLMRIEERRAQSEATTASGWQTVAMAINNLANAIILCGETIADAITRHV